MILNFFFKNTESDIFKKFGFYKDNSGIYERYLSESDNWASHLKNTSDCVINSALTKNKNLCVVLGSGWWLDIPVADLSEIFNNIILVDIVHPRQISHFSKRFSNVKLVEADITCSAKRIFESAGSFEKVSLNNFYNLNNKFGLEFYDDTDFFVSANVLSQINVFFENFLTKTKKYSPQEINLFSQQIQQEHFNNLPQNKTCLVADWYEKFYDISGNLMNEGKRIFIDLPENKTEKEWEWIFDSKGNYKINRKVVFSVKYLDV